MSLLMRLSSRPKNFWKRSWHFCHRSTIQMYHGDIFSIFRNADQMPPRGKTWVPSYSAPLHSKRWQMGLKSRDKCSAGLKSYRSQGGVKLACCIGQFHPTGLTKGPCPESRHVYVTRHRKNACCLEQGSKPTCDGLPLYTLTSLWFHHPK